MAREIFSLWKAVACFLARQDFGLSKLIHMLLVWTR